MSQHEKPNKGHLESLFVHATIQSHPRALLDSTSVVLTADELNERGKELIHVTVKEEQISTQEAVYRISERITLVSAFITAMNATQPKDVEQLLIEEGFFKAPSSDN